MDLPEKTPVAKPPVPAGKWASAVVMGPLAIAPVPCRMLLVDVFEVTRAAPGEPTRAVSWAEVIGFAVACPTSYSRHYLGDRPPRAGDTHAEMIEAGYHSDAPGMPMLEAWPVVVRSHENGEDSIRIMDGRGWDSISNRLHRTVVPCDWPRGCDREHAIRIGRELIKHEGINSTWAPIPEDDV